MKQLIYFFTFLFAVSATAQTTKPLGSTNPLDNNRIPGRLQVDNTIKTPTYATDDTDKVAGWDAQGNIVQRTKSNGVTGTGDVTLLQLADSLTKYLSKADSGSYTSLNRFKKDSTAKSDIIGIHRVAIDSKANLSDTSKFKNKGDTILPTGYKTNRQAALDSAAVNTALLDHIEDSKNPHIVTWQQTTDIGDTTIHNISSGRISIVNRGKTGIYYMPFGDSFTAAGGATVLAFGYAFRQAQYYGLEHINFGEAGVGGYSCIKKIHASINIGHNVLLSMCWGLNDQRRRNGVLGTFGYSEDERLIFNTYYTAASNHFMANVEQAGTSANVMRSGAFTIMSVIPYGGKSANAAVTTTFDDTLKYISCDTTPVAICMQGGDGVNTTFAPYSIYNNSILIRNGVTNGNAPNSLEGPSNYDNRRDPFTEVVKGVHIGDTIKVICKASGPNDSLIIDYIGNWLTPASLIGTPVIAVLIPKGDTSHASVDSLTMRNARLDSIMKTFNPYPVYVVPMTYYNAHYYDISPAFTSADKLHPSDFGHFIIDSLIKSIVNIRLKPKADFDVTGIARGDIIRGYFNDSVRVKFDQKGDMRLGMGSYVASGKNTGYNMRLDSLSLYRYIYGGTSERISLDNDSIKIQTAPIGVANALIPWVNQVVIKPDNMYIPHNVLIGLNNGNTVVTMGNNLSRVKWGRASSYYDLATGDNGTEALLFFGSSNATGSTAYMGMSITNTGQWAVNAGTNSYANAMFSVYGKNTKQALRLIGGTGGNVNIVEVHNGAAVTGGFNKAADVFSDKAYFNNLSSFVSGTKKFLVINGSSTIPNEVQVQSSITIADVIGQTDSNKVYRDSIMVLSGRTATTGEANTASNLGGGLANYSTKSGVDLRFNSYDPNDFDLASNLISLDATLKTNWNTAFGWGNHTSAGYETATHAAATYSALAHTHSFSGLTAKPTTLSGYGITDAQGLNTHLTIISGLTPSNDHVLQYKSGAWANRTMAQLKTDLVLVKTDVGLSNVDNTSDATKNSTTATLTNKRITKRIGTTVSSSTPTPDADAHDVYTVTALAATATFGAPAGTPTDGQGLIIRIKDNGTARSLSFNVAYRFSTDIVAPTTTVLSKTMYLGFIWNAADSKWDCVAKIDNI